MGLVGGLTTWAASQIASPTSDCSIALNDQRLPVGIRCAGSSPGMALWEVGSSLGPPKPNDRLCDAPLAVLH